MHTRTGPYPKFVVDPKERINFLLDTLRPFSDRVLGGVGDDLHLRRCTHSSSIDGVGVCSSAAALVIAVFMRRYVEAPEWFVGRRSWSVLCGAGFSVRAGCASLTYLGLPVALEHTSIVKMNYS